WQHSRSGSKEREYCHIGNRRRFCSVLPIQKPGRYLPMGLQRIIWIRRKSVLFTMLLYSHECVTRLKPSSHVGFGEQFSRLYSGDCWLWSVPETRFDDQRCAEV
ncbi:hypothetical protein D910_05497, partial [Dendroctonus ponderosae]